MRLSYVWRKFDHMSNPPALLGVSEVARRLDVSTRTVLRLIAAGKIATVAKMPGDTGMYLITEAALADYKAALVAS